MSKATTMDIVEFLSRETGKSDLHIRNLIEQAPRMYKVYRIPKRTTGYRVIAQPSKEIKILQRHIIVWLEKKLPVHSSAIAYRKGKDIKTNALLHIKSSYMLKMDFEDFFNSINPELFKKSLILDSINLGGVDINYLVRLLFWNPSKRKNGKLILSVGAPSSPLISNYVMYRFDCAIEEHCKLKNVTYSRYADDMTFSTLNKNGLFAIPEFVRMTLKKKSYKRISIKQSKTAFSSKAHNRHVTGVTLTNDDKISIGRAKKRMLSSMIFKSLQNQLDNEELSTLKGLLGQAFYIDEAFENSMILKYGYLAIDNILGKNNEKT